MSEYIGSHISLISKSDIKYIGTLHEINSENHTVALESVTSYGTEGRKGNPAEEIPGSDQVYEYIVFRGSDVKELNIIAPPSAPKENERPKMPDDPAILGSARPAPAPQAPPAPQQPEQNQFRGPPGPYPPQQQFGYQGPPPPNAFQGQPRFQGAGGPHGFPGTPGAVPGYGYGPPPGQPPPGYGMGYPPPGHGFGPPPPGGPYGPGPGPGPGPNVQFGQMGKQPGQQRPQEGGPNPSQAPIGSPYTTPQPTGQISQPPQSNKPVEMAATPGESHGNAQAPAPPVHSKPSTAASQAVTSGPNQSATTSKPAQKVDQRVAVPLPPPHVLAAKPTQRSGNNVQTQSAGPAVTAQPLSFQDATQAAAAAVTAAMAKLGNSVSGKTTTDGYDNLAQKVNQMRFDDSQQHRGRGRTRGTGTRGARRDSGQRAVEVPKEDFDFQSANAKFNKQDLIKEAIATGYPIGTTPETETAAPPSATNGHANGAAAEDTVIPPQPEIEKGYNKKSSFFDDISSDLKDRVAQAQQQASIDGRAIRREERSKNMETFGQGSVDSGFRGGYRGRGRGRGFSRGGYRGRGGLENQTGDNNNRGGYRGRGRGEANAA